MRDKGRGWVGNASSSAVRRTGTARPVEDGLVAALPLRCTGPDASGACIKPTRVSLSCAKVVVGFISLCVFALLLNKEQQGHESIRGVGMS